MNATPAEARADADHGGGNGLLWVLLAAAVVFAVIRPRAPLDYVRLVDWQTVGALAGLLAITQGVERSGMLQAAAARLLSRTTDLRNLVFLLAASAAVLSALVTNDVSLFLLVPLTRVLATQAHLPLARLVVIEALAVNAGSALTPIGNPQNLFLWHRSGESFVGFMAMMAPTVAVMLFWLFVAIRFLVPRAPITLKPSGRSRAASSRACWPCRACSSSASWSRSTSAGCSPDWRACSAPSCCCARACCSASTGPCSRSSR